MRASSLEAGTVERMMDTRSTSQCVIVTCLSLGLAACLDLEEPIDPETLGDVASDVTVRSGVDYSWARPSPSGLRAAGYTFAVRYLSFDTTGKNLSASEARALQAAGIDLVSNWESGASDALKGRTRGVSDAQEAT